MISGNINTNEIGSLICFAKAWH